MFAKRLFLYFIGFFFGSIIVYFLLFRNKDRNFFPSAIVLDSLKSKELVIEKNAECFLSCYKIPSENIKILLEDGDVIFSESSPREKPQKYVVEIKNPEKEKVKLTFELSKDTAKIIFAKMENEKQKCLCE